MATDSTSTSNASDRRPLASRRLPIFKKFAAALAARNISPNTVSIWSIYAGLLAGGFLKLTAVTTSFHAIWWTGAAIAVQLRLLANMLDGMVAVEHGKGSPVGGLYNEVPDRISDTAILLGLGLAAGSSLTLGLLAALGAMFTAYIRAMGKTVADYQEFCGPCAKPQRMFLVTLCCLLMAFGPEWLKSFTVFGVECTLPVATLLVISIGTVITSYRRLSRITRRLTTTV